MSQLSDKALFISTVGKLGKQQANHGRPSASKPLTATLADLIKASGVSTGKAAK